MTRSSATLLPALLPLTLALSGCHPKAVSNEQEAARAYLGLDGAVARAMNLGMDGYNAASSANIDAQTASGDLDGTITVTGQVDQGSSDNKELRLDATLVDYLDDTVDGDAPFTVVYDTDPSTPAALDLSLRDIPDGTLTGTLAGDFAMSGDLEGFVSLDLTLDGTIEAGADGEAIERVDGDTHIVGTASSDYGVYDVDLLH